MLEDRLLHRFTDRNLLKLALTHRSMNISGEEESNQRLEFFGDRVLGLIVAEMLYREFPEENEGALARRLASLVGRPPLVRVARQTGLGEELRLSNAEGAGGGRELESILEDACEAVIGALYLDGGTKAAERFVHHYWKPLLDAEPFSEKDAKTSLQEWAQGHGHGLPAYEIAEQEGPDHAPRFTIRVSVGKWSATGEGTPKRGAEQQAARNLLELVKGESA